MFGKLILARFPGLTWSFCHSFSTCQSLSQPGLFNDCVTNLFGGQGGDQQKWAEADGNEVTVTLFCKSLTS